MQPPSPTSYDDYLRRWEALIVSFLCVGYQRMLDSKGGLKNLFLGGSVITREELERLFETGWAEPEEETDDYDLRAQMEAFYEGLSDDAPFAPEVIYRVFELNDFGFFMLGLAYFLKLNKKYQRIFGYLQDDIRRTDPTLGLAAFLFAPYRAVSAWEAASLFTHPLIRSLLFGGWEEEAHQELYDREIHLSDSIFAYLQGFVLPPAQPFGRVTKPVRAQAAREALLQGLGKKLSTAQAGGAHTLVCFCGEVGAGRTFSARHVAALEGRYLVELDLATLLMRDQQEQCRTVAEIVVDCVLHGYWLYLREVPTEPPQCERALELLRTLCKTLPVVALSCTGNGDMFHLSGVAVCRVELDMPDAAQSLRYWQVCAGAFSLAADLSSLAGRYRLLPGDIRSCFAVDGRGARSGTPNYMAPEVYHGAEASYCADVYSLGLTLYVLLHNGCLPFSPGTELSPTALNRRLAGEALPRPAHGSDHLWAVVERACAFSPELRFASARGLRLALEQCRS